VLSLTKSSNFWWADTNSGLVQRIKDSNVSMQQAEKQTIDFLQAHVNPGALRSLSVTIVAISIMVSFFGNKPVISKSIQIKLLSLEGAAKNIVALNAGAAIYVSGVADSLQAGIDKAISNNRGNFNNGVFFLAISLSFLNQSRLSCYLDLNEQQNKPCLNKGGLSTPEKPKRSKMLALPNTT
jgi:hypothetical protein